MVVCIRRTRAGHNIPNEVHNIDTEKNAVKFLVNDFLNKYLTLFLY